MTEQPPEPSEQLDQQDPEQSLVDRGSDDPLDEGYSPPERWSTAERTGNTAAEEAAGEGLDERLRQEIAEPDPREAAQDDETAGADADDDKAQPVDPDPVDPEVGDRRAGRLEQADEQVDGVAEDVGISGAGASAEEAAVHVVDDPESPPDPDGGDERR